MNCRICQIPLSHVLSLGNIPLANYFLTKKERTKQRSFPLEFFFCLHCQLGQLGTFISPSDIFQRYHYVTGASEPLLQELSSLADYCMKTFKSKSVLDVGANDGSLLSYFKKRKITTVAVEPAKNLARQASAKGLTVISDFFSQKLAKTIQVKHGRFDLITATHVLANIPDLQDFIEGITMLLSPHGMFIIEVASLEDMLKIGNFDSIYHEHYWYFTVAGMHKLLRRYNFSVFRYEKTKNQGTSHRFFIKPMPFKSMQKTQAVDKKSLVTFARHAQRYKKSMQTLFRRLSGKQIVGFGAPAKAVTLLNYCKIGKEQMDFIVDSTPEKQEKLLPGTLIPIHPEEYLEQHPPGVLLILAWNYKKEILAKIQRLLKRNVPIITSFPKLQTTSLK